MVSSQRWASITGTHEAWNLSNALSVLMGSEMVSYDH